ncbi:MAG: hypothetical protein JNK65_05815 [Deltaproteobacteria bacterium]|nr:hypothetical protein [Deltaproteobacteria bacterium]
MKKSLILMLSGLISFGALNCSSNHPGIEVGNPTGNSLKGKSILFEVENTPQNYVLSFKTKTQSNFYQLLGEDLNETEVASLAYQVIDQQALLSNLFSDGSQPEVEVKTSSEGTYLSSSLKLNQQVFHPISVEETPTALSCNLLNSDPNSKITETICSQILTCNPDLDCNNCNDSVLASTSVMNLLSDPSNQPSAVDICLDEVAKLPCFVVNKAYRKSDTEPYKHLKLILPKPFCAKGTLK